MCIRDSQILRFFGGHEPYERRGALSAILAAKRLLRRTRLTRHGDAGDGGTLARALIDDLTHPGTHFPRGVLGKNTLVPSAHIVGENDPQGFVHPFIGKRQIGLRHLEPVSYTHLDVYKRQIWSTVTDRLCPNEEEIR